jgi:homoserine dehydrogenase
MVRKDSAIAQVMGVTNAVTVDAADINPLTLVGPGAGGAATASAVLSDIGDIARGVRTAPFGRPTGRLTTVRKAPMQRHEGGYYIRLVARDKPGTAATIAVILITYATSEDAVRKALAAVGRDRVISGRPQVIRIEKN